MGMQGKSHRIFVKDNRFDRFFPGALLNLCVPAFFLLAIAIVLAAGLGLWFADNTLQDRYNST